MGLITGWIDKHLSDDDRRYLLADFTPHDVNLLVLTSIQIRLRVSMVLIRLSTSITEILLAIMLRRHVSLESKENLSLQKSKTQSWFRFQEQKLATLHEYRPIALCNVIYKILSKVLVNRLKPIIHKIISDNHSAFLLDRSISDNVIVAAELMYFIKWKTQAKSGITSLKIDISKVFDRIEWSFIKAMLTILDFPPGWCFVCPLSHTESQSPKALR